MTNPPAHALQVHVSTHGVLTRPVSRAVARFYTKCRGEGASGGGGGEVVSAGKRVRGPRASSLFSGSFCSRSRLVTVAAAKWGIFLGCIPADHLGEMEEALSSGVLKLPDMASRILKTARVTARLYRLQLEEIGSY